MPDSLPFPRVSINLALSADGKISDPLARPSGWTSSTDHQRLLQLRCHADALLVGRRTWLADRMTMLSPHSATPPLRCIVTRHGTLDPLHPIFSTPGGDIHVICTESLPSEPPHSHVFFHQENLASFLHTLHTSHQVRSLHCEGGGYLIRELLRINAVDTLHLTIAGHTIFGGLHSPTAIGIPDPEFFTPPIHLSLESFEPQPATGECFLTYRRSAQ